MLAQVAGPEQDSNPGLEEGWGFGQGVKVKMLFRKGHRVWHCGT